MNMENIISKMTLKDKIALCSGGSFWQTKAFPSYEIPDLFMCDGPHGLRKQDLSNGADMLGVNDSIPSTCFPCQVTSAASFDTLVMEQIGKAIGEEAHNQKCGLVLGPGANLKRNPLCGRNFEYLSEDPYLAGKMAASFIKGLEGTGISSSLKHFAVNSQEKDRFISNSILDERTLCEMYLTAFEIAVKEGKPSTVMCSYPKLNGVHCSDSPYLLNHILRKDWGFEGCVITDWGALNDRIRAFEAGCDLSMPGRSTYMEKDAYKAVKNGTLDEEKINDSVRRILTLVKRSQENLHQEVKCDYNSHDALAYQVACKGAVLLKNEDQILPLKKDAEIALIGAMAKNMRYQGSGSSHINPKKLTQPYDCFEHASYAQGCDEKGNTTDALLKEAADTAYKADRVIVFAGLPDAYESEGFDRENMKMPQGHIRMIEACTKANENVIVVLMCGAPVECDWADHVKAILYMGLPGQAGGKAVHDLLYGIVNPSGRLAESWPYHYEDCACSSSYGMKDALYKEGIYVGYRYYDKAGVPVRWPFGYGLSYTTFTYTDLKIQNKTVTVTITNTGCMEGDETILLYVHNPQNGIHRPVRELRRFTKVHLKPQESTTVSFTLDERCFSVYDNGWKVPAGTYQIEVNNLKAFIEVSGETVKTCEYLKDTWYETCKGKPSMSDFEKLIGHPYVPEKPEKGKFTMDNTVVQMKDYSLIMKIMYKAVEMTVSKGKKPDYNDPQFRMLINSSAGSPLRNMQISGGMPDGIMQGLMEMANGHMLKGIIRMIKGE